MRFELRKYDLPFLVGGVFFGVAYSYCVFQEHLIGPWHSGFVPAASFVGAILLRTSYVRSPKKWRWLPRLLRDKWDQSFRIDDRRARGKVAELLGWTLVVVGVPLVLLFGLTFCEAVLSP